MPAAAFGGTTTIVDFAVQSRGASLRAGLDAWHAKAEGNAVADYGFHMIMSDVNDDTLAEMDGLVAEGVPDFKLFTAYPGVFYSDDGAIFRAMQQTAKNGGLIMMHAENGMAIDVVAAQTVRVGRPTRSVTGSPARPSSRARRPTGSSALPRRPACRSTSSTCRPARRWPRSARRATRLDGVRRDLSSIPVPVARRPGQRVRGRQVRVSPPLRPKDHWDDLWSGLLKDDLQAVYDDFPVRFPRPNSLAGRLPQGPRIGLPGVEDRVDLLHDGGVVAGRISLERWVEVISTAPAKLFGMYPRKGAVAVGSDADLVVYDPNRRHIFSAATHHMDVDYSCYEGRSVQGGSDIVLSRGSVIVRDGEFTGRKGAGRFIKRSTADYARMS